MYNYHTRVLTVPVNVRRIQLHGGAPSAVPTAHVAPQVPTHPPTHPPTFLRRYVGTHPPIDLPT